MGPFSSNFSTHSIMVSNQFRNSFLKRQRKYKDKDNDYDNDKEVIEGLTGVLDLRRE